MDGTEVIEYSFRWYYRRNRPGMPLSEQDARAKDTAGEEYTAVLPPRPGTPLPGPGDASVEGPAWALVTFGNAHGHLDVISGHSPWSASLSSFTQKS